MCLPAHILSQFQDFLKSFGPGSSNSGKISQIFWESSTFPCFSCLPLFKPLKPSESVFRLLSDLGRKRRGGFFTLSSCVFFTCIPIPKCGFTISVLVKCNAIQYNGNYSDYYSSVPALKSWASESEGRKYMLFLMVCWLYCLWLANTVLERMWGYSFSLNFGQKPIIAEMHLWMAEQYQASIFVNSLSVIKTTP